MPFHIAIDGPVAAGKGTVSRLVAQRLGFLYVDTGAMYRMTALLALENNVAWDDEQALVALLRKTKMEMRNPTNGELDGRLLTVLLNGEDVSWRIRTEKIGEGSSIVSAFPLVRKILVEKQQEIAKNQNVVMEGRDITSVVLPNADLKIYLTASDIVRAKRRHLQLMTKGIDISYQEVLSDLRDRDYRDMNRETDPLVMTDDSLLIDTSDLDIDKVVEMIVAKVNLMRA